MAGQAGQRQNRNTGSREPARRARRAVVFLRPPADPARVGRDLPRHAMDARPSRWSRPVPRAVRVRNPGIVSNESGARERGPPLFGRTRREGPPPIGGMFNPGTTPRSAQYGER
jgi:hypothetical protein